MKHSNSNIIDVCMQIGNSTLRPVRIFKKASGEIKTPDGDTWQIYERTTSGCMAKSTTKFAEAGLFYCYNCPNNEFCEFD